MVSKLHRKLDFQDEFWSSDNDSLFKSTKKIILFLTETFFIMGIKMECLAQCIQCNNIYYYIITM